MKLVVILICITGLMGSYASVYSQQTKLDLNVRKATVKDVLRLIEDQSEFTFMYNASKIDVYREIDLNVEKSSVEDILKKIFAGEDVSYRIIARNIIISSNSEVTETAQQQKSISGKVTDSSGGPLPGVSVVVKGTTTGSITDAEGNFTLSNVPVNATLQFSFVGMKSQELAIGNKTTINVVMEEEPIGIEEVVAVGYGTMKKSDLTGSIATLNQDNMKDKMVSSIDQKLIGQVAGVQVQAVSGAPGAGTSIKIRGTGSMGAGNEPLFVVDGMPYSSGSESKLNPLVFINPNDIESVTILKDASSTAIYGSRGSNGVVMITTKKGSFERTDINVSSMYGVQQVPQKGRPKMMNQMEFADMQREKIGALIRIKEYREPTAPDYPVEYLPENLSGEGTDWFDLILHSAIVQDHNISINKGTKDSRLNFSMGYLSQEGVVQYTGLERFSGKLTMESNIGKSVKIGASLQPTFINQNRTGTNTNRNDIIGIATWANPVMTPYDVNGNLKPYIQSPANKYAAAWSFANPLFTLREAPEIQKNFQNLGITYIEWEIILGLKAKTSLNTNFSSSKYSQYIPSFVGNTNAPPTVGTGKSSNNRGDSFNWVIENTLNYEKTINKHRFNGMLGYTTQKSTADNIILNADPYSNDLIETINAAKAIKSWGQTINEWSMISYLGRINYSFADKYLLTATMRTDGSSRFGAKNRYASFPSIAAAWRISEEPFMNGYKMVDNLKLRVSYGRSGNDNIGNYAHLASINSGSYIFGTTQVTASRIGISNPYLTWEESGQIDVGIDLGLFKNRLSFVVDYYNRKSINMLLNDVISATTGFNNQIVNKGNVTNTGVELSLGGTPVDGQFRLDMNLNLAFNRNKVLSLNEKGDPIYGYTSDGITHISKVGQPIGQFFGFVFEGLYTAADLQDPKVAKHPLAFEGTRKYKDINGDGLINTILDFDVIGNPYPDFIFGFTNNFSYRKFDLSVVINGQYGGQVINGLRGTIDNTHAFFNVQKEFVNRWRSAADPGDGIHYGVALYPGGLGHNISTLFIEDATYLKIANLTLGYSMPKELMKITGFITNCRFNLSIQNLAMFTKYKGANPEAQSANQNNDLTPGWDISSYPLARTASFGVNLTF